METRPLVVLSYGAGQDSDAILELLHRDPAFRERFVGASRLIVVHADTGDEHPETYAHVEDRKRWCAERGIEFVHIQPAMGFHGETWQSLMGQYRHAESCGSKRYAVTCSVNLKQVPIYRFLESFLAREYGLSPSRKEGFYEYRLRQGPMRILLGFAADEARRSRGFQAKTKAGKWAVPEKWKRECLVAVYPLQELGWTRRNCQEYLRGAGRTVPLPSNCMRCPFLNELELVWLHRFYPERLREWVEVEAAKIRADETKRGIGDPAKRLGVWGARRLPEVLAEALTKYGSWSDAQLWEHKLTHGHHVRSAW